MISELELLNRMVDRHTTLPSLLKQADEHTLIVIGNGFDVAHAIKSKYNDFRTWLLAQGHEYLVNSISSFFPEIEDDIDSWGDVETAMGFYNEKAILGECRPHEEFDYDHSIQSAARVTDSVDAFFKPQLDKFRDLFVEWVNGLDINAAEPFLNLPRNAKYLSFNYTEILEQIYGISPEHIVHIHGSRLPHGEEYVFGHFLKKSPEDVYGDEEALTFESEAHENVVRWMNDWYKPTEDYILKHRDLFWHLEDVHLVIYMGKTINKVDKDYFCEIQEHIPDDAKVYMTYHGDIEPIQIVGYLEEESLLYENWRLIRW